ncbi:hypothetical protein ACFU76_09175 [Streptomyces sp. NPDC057539]|uniref:hypothetical protein n=1 Tax=Streptomyces sp. NPDC057539 TaxID=3346159 RepID=UPI0036CB821C
MTFKEAWLAVSLVGFRLVQSSAPLHVGAAVSAAEAGAPLPTPSAANATAIAETATRPEDLMSTPLPPADAVSSGRHSRQ